MTFTSFKAYQLKIVFVCFLSGAVRDLWAREMEDAWSLRAFEETVLCQISPAEKEQIKATDLLKHILS